MINLLAELVTFPALMAGMVAFLVALGLVATQHLHGHLSMDSLIGIQKFHTNPTPRVGGVAVAVGVAVGYFVSPNGFFHGLLWPVLLAGVPAFGFGLAEDITKRVSVSLRLLATMASGVGGWFITGLSITDVNIPGVDILLGVSLISVLFTAFAVGGIANAVNIIDGFNGLASGSVVLMLTGLAFISAQAGDVQVARVCVVFAFTALGLLLVNWPSGKIFLGDGGAYFLGFAVAWMAVLVLARNPEVSAWAPMLVCGYPVLEVGFSIWRRRRRNLSPGAPDRLHLHSLVSRRLVRPLLPLSSKLVCNSTAGALMWLVAIVPMLIAVRYWQNTAMLAVGFVFCGFLYSSIYARLTQFRWCFRAATLQPLQMVKQP